MLISTLHFSPSCPSKESRTLELSSLLAVDRCLRIIEKPYVYRQQNEYQLVGKSLPQCLHIMAACLMVSAQKGQSLLSSSIAVISIVSELSPKTNSSKKLKSGDSSNPRKNQPMPKRPFLSAQTPTINARTNQRKYSMM